MPRPAINDSLWAEMTAAQKSDAVRAGGATLRQTVAGLLDGPDELNRACQEILSRADASLKELVDGQLSRRDSAAGDPGNPSFDDQLEQRDSTTNNEYELLHQCASTDASHLSEGRSAPIKRRRLGLPLGYLPRLHRHERLVRK